MASLAIHLSCRASCGAVRSSSPLFTTTTPTREVIINHPINKNDAVSLMMFGLRRVGGGRRGRSGGTDGRGNAVTTRAYGGGGEDIWDPDEQRRINENKSWKRTDSPNDAWDIDKERDAVMYRRESLERLLALTPEEEKPDRPLVCSGCKAPVSSRRHESRKDKAHLHRLNYGDSFVSVGVYDAATVDVDPKGRGDDAKAGDWWPPRAAVKCCCRGCGEVLGWRVEDNAEEKVGPFFALLTARLITQ